MTAPVQTPDPSTPLPRLSVDIWSDIACPWCYIGKRRFEAALRAFPQAAQVDVVWHSFELNPTAPAVSPVGVRDGLAQKYGTSAAQAQQMLDSMTLTAAQEGLAYDFEALRPTNTFQAHQVLQLAAEHGVQPALKERLLRAHLQEGLMLGDPETLVSLAAEVGLDAGEVRTALTRQTYAQAVRQDEAMARTYGIQGVPFFVLGSKYGVSGAQSSETLLGALQQTWAELAPPSLLHLLGPVSSADGCEDGSCAVPGTPPPTEGSTP